MVRSVRCRYHYMLWCAAKGSGWLGAGPQYMGVLGMIHPKYGGSSNLLEVAC